MPKRTNALQKAIKLIEEYKGDFLELQESAMLYDQTAGIKREVDIVLIGEINGHSITIAFEVTGGKRPVDVQWVESMISKHKNLSTDKLILVSSSGFTKSAEKKAKESLAEPIDSSADDRNLRELLEKAAYIRGVQVFVLVFIDDKPISPTAKLKIGNSSDSTNKQIKVLLKNEKFKEVLFQAGEREEPGIIAEFRSSFSVDGKGSLVGQILKFVFIIDCITDVPVKLSTINYKGVDYIYGKVVVFLITSYWMKMEDW